MPTSCLAYLQRCATALSPPPPSASPWHRLTAGGKRLAVVRKRGTPFGVRARRKGKPARRVTVVALNRSGRKLASRSARIRAVVKGKRRVGGGEELRTSAGATASAAGSPRKLGRAAEARRIALSGSNVALPLVADLAFDYRRTVRRPPRFTLTGGGSAAGLSDAPRGIVDIGLTTPAAHVHHAPAAAPLRARHAGGVGLRRLRVHQGTARSCRHRQLRGRDSNPDNQLQRLASCH